MKKILYTALILLFMLSSLEILANTSDSTIQITKSIQGNAPTAQDEDFSPALFMGAMAVSVFVLVSLGIGIAITVIGLLIIFGLVSFGILSTSIIVGLYKKSFVKGFKTLIVLASMIGGILLFGTGFWLLNNVTHWTASQAAIIMGVFSGLIAGLIFGLLVFSILQKLTAYFKQKLNLATDDSIATING